MDHAVHYYDARCHEKPKLYAVQPICEYGVSVAILARKMARERLSHDAIVMEINREWSDSESENDTDDSDYNPDFDLAAGENDSGAKL